MNPTAYDMWYFKAVEQPKIDQRELALKRAKSRAAQPRRRDNKSLRPSRARS